MKLKFYYVSPIIYDAIVNAPWHAGHQCKAKLCPCLLELPGEMFGTRNCLQLVGTLVQNRPEVFSGIASVPFPGQISHTQKEQVVATPVLHIFGCAEGGSSSDQHDSRMHANAYILQSPVKIRITQSRSARQVAK